MRTEYYIIIPEKREQLGIRLFAYNPNSDHVVQVCMSSGNKKKGRTSCIGIYEVHRATFLNNYFNYKQVQECSKKEYEKAMTTVYQALKIVLS
jgi:hypothetical protein